MTRVSADRLAAITAGGKLLEDLADVHDRIAALEAALRGLDAPMQWLNDHYPKAMQEMPTHTFRAFDAARAALAGPEADDA